MKYRNDIQALRGIAVLAVVLYHLKIPFFQSGFIGVDVFFVISGYLMAFSLRGTDSANIKDFYKRRAKRILPVYLFVLVLLLVVSPLFFMPFEIKDYIKRLPFFLTGVPNLGFWMDNTYFAYWLFRPALHFWSLGVELQFYLIVPIILYFHKKSGVYTVIILILSLLSCMLMTDISAKTAFFMTPFRVWEFLAGFLLAKWWRDEFFLSNRAWLRPVLFYSSIIAIVFVSYIFINPEVNFPWFYAVPVVAASFLFIAADYRPKYMVGKSVFSVLEKIGQQSYSIYLFHFPIIYILIYKPFERRGAESIDNKTILAALVLTAVCSALSYRFIETPYKKFSFANKPVFSYGSLALILAMLVAGWVGAIPASLARISPNDQMKKIFVAMTDFGPYRCGRVNRMKDPAGRSCIMTDFKLDETRPTVLFVGDSHADATKHVMVEQAAAHGLNLLMMKTSCALGVGECSVRNVKQEAIDRGVDYVLLHAAPKSNDPAAISKLVKRGQEHGFHVLLLDPTPAWPEGVPLMVYRAILKDDASLLPSHPQSEYMRHNRELLDWLEDYSAPNFSRYEIIDQYCTPECRAMSNDGYLYFYDSSHVTLRGADLLQPVVDEMFRNIEHGQ